RRRCCRNGLNPTSPVWSGPPMETLLVERADAVLTVTMNRPERKNAITQTMERELRDVLRDAADRDDDRVVVLTGAGGAFCSGADLSAPGEGGTAGLASMRRISDLVLVLHQ